MYCNKIYLYLKMSNTPFKISETAFHMSDSFFQRPEQEPLYEEGSYHVINCNKVTDLSYLYRQFYHIPVPEELKKFDFTSDLSWDEISKRIIEYFENTNVTYEQSECSPIFEIKSTTNDSRLNIIIRVYIQKDETFVVVCDRKQGDIFTAIEIKNDLKILLNDKLSYDDLVRIKEREEEEDTEYRKANNLYREPGNEDFDSEYDFNTYLG